MFTPPLSPPASTSQRAQLLPSLRSLHHVMVSMNTHAPLNVDIRNQNLFVILLICTSTILYRFSDTLKSRGIFIRVS